MIKNTHRVLAVIPARGGSKGIPLKNLYEIEGIPLIQYVLNAAKGSKYIDTIMVSTDNENIAKHAIKEGASVPYLRNSNLATDTAKTIWAIHDAVSYYSKEKEEYDIIVTLQPTQPLIQAWHIDEALSLFMEKKQSVIGVSLCETPPVLLRRKNADGLLSPLYPQENSTIRRQDMEKIYMVNGMLYINRAMEILQNRELSLNDNKIGYTIANEYAVDIDTLYDVELCLMKMEHLRKNHRLDIYNPSI